MIVYRPSLNILPRLLVLFQDIDPRTLFCSMYLRTLIKVTHNTFVSKDSANLNKRQDKSEKVSEWTSGRIHKQNTSNVYRVLTRLGSRLVQVTIQLDLCVGSISNSIWMCNINHCLYCVFSICHYIHVLPIFSIKKKLKNPWTPTINDKQTNKWNDKFCF